MSALSTSVPFAAGPTYRALKLLSNGSITLNQRYAQHVAGFGHANPENLWALVVVIVVHLLLLGGLAHHLSLPILTAVPPAVVGILVTTEPPVVVPVPLPMVAQPKPLPRLVVQRRQPRPPAPVAAPTERAVPAPPPEPVAPVVADVAAAQAPASFAPPGPTPELVAAPQSVIPPRADAAHLNNPAPVYPPMSRRMGEQGRVQLDVYILADGSVGQIKLKRSSGYTRLDQAALEAVQHWRYQPASRGNEAIALWYVQPLTFSLDS